MGIENAGTFALGGDITVNRLGFGAMRLCGPGVWGHPADRDNPAVVLRRCVKLGINLIDTADAYGPEVNEYQIAAALRPYTGLTIATKGGLVRSGPGSWERAGHPDRLGRCINNSLRRLEVDHRPLPAALARSVRALSVTFKVTNRPSGEGSSCNFETLGPRYVPLFGQTAYRYDKERARRGAVL